MNGYHFITGSEYTEILAKIAAKEKFEHERNYKKVTINIHSGKAGCVETHQRRSGIKGGEGWLNVPMTFVWFHI